MHRWSMMAKEHVENQRVDGFLLAIIDVYEKYGLSLAHEEDHGAFIVESMSDENIEWMKNASLNLLP